MPRSSQLPVKVLCADCGKEYQLVVPDDTEPQFSSMCSCSVLNAAVRVVLDANLTDEQKKFTDFGRAMSSMLHTLRSEGEEGEER